MSLFKGADDAEELPRWRRLVPVLLALALASALGLLFHLATQATVERDRALALQRHSYEVIALARDVKATAARAESFLARYVVSLDANDGRRYTDEWQRTGALLATLRRVTRDNAVQRANGWHLAQAYVRRGSALNDIALRTTYDQRLGALGRLYAENRRQDADRIDQLLDRVIACETALLAHRSDRVDEWEVRMARLAGGYSLIGAALLIAALVALWVANSSFTEHRYVRRLAEAEARRVDDLEVAVRERTEELQEANLRLRDEMEERAQAEASLRQLHKMEAIGQLTGGIAHDFNNMLAVVMGGLELARRRLDHPAEAERHIDSAMEGATRAASLTRRLLSFARAERLEPGAIDPDQLIEGMAELVDRTLGDQIELVIVAGANGWQCWADPNQLENALLNLCVNARDAMEGRGTLHVTSGRVQLTAGDIGDCPGGDYVRLSVRDTGHGMTPEVMERAFEPFFTTKPVGRGTGLGLSQVFGYVRQCGGELRIRSVVGEGTEVEIFLPRNMRETPAVTQSAPAATDGGYGRDGSAKLLVVEDDPRVLSSTLAALSELGYTAVACSSPDEAATTLAAHDDIAIILTDVLMPGMTGPEMVTDLRAQGVTLPVIFVTGFAGEEGEAGLLDGEHVLRKPYTLAQLSHCIDGLLLERAQATA